TPYFSSGMSPSLTWSGSWYSRPLYPEESQFFGIQLTYNNHNDDNKTLSDAAQSIQWGTAYTYPMKNMEVGAQIHGMFFVKVPGSTVYSREPYVYFAPMINLHLYQGLQLMLSPEILVSSAKETTVFTGYGPKDSKNYTPWQLSGNIRYMPSTPFYSSDPFAKAGQGRRGAGAAALRERLNRESRNSLFDWTVDSERDLQFLNLDLEKTRIERQRAEEELLKLKKDLGK
ncbi:MAG: hypothetical protein OEM52_12905, partial [bacterium]|nr:hypothetical protein [bacterium]